MTAPAPHVFGNARFTVLADRLIRCEWAEDGRFEDLPTLTVSQRIPSGCRVKRKVAGKAFSLRTDCLDLVYEEDGKPFSAANLSIAFAHRGNNVVWTPGKKDPRNLKGTAKTLDGVDGGAVPLCDGLISRSGWAVVDDSTSCVLDPALCAWQPWVREREPGIRRDLYFLGYSLDYKAALRDASRVFGRQPLPPRYALGYWYSRYWAYTDKELLQLADDFAAMNLPLDVLVIDMDWHKLGWTGYSWDPGFFPDPPALLRELRRRGLKITLNLHPADGVFDFEDAFPDMQREMGLRREDCPPLEPVFHRLYELLGLDPHTATRIPLDITDPNYMRAYFKCLHHPLERQGVDFWWMDWQQGRTGSTLPNLDTLPWINELHWQDQARRRPRRRPINFSRFGGVGAGRMPVGFSGDTIVTWESLAFQPHFTATAANVLYGYWSHDIGGHMRGQLTPELYTRWLQFGLFSPILRTHTSKSMDSERRVFHFPDPARTVMADTLRRRYELAPYLYGEMRKGVDSGLSLVRPMYHEHPAVEAAYRCPCQYQFGDDLIVAPVLSPMDPKTETGAVRFWLPEGDWVDLARGLPLQGGGWHTGRYTLAETPVFARPGAVIPEQRFVTRLKAGPWPEPVFRIIAGASGEGALYEDDGESTDWTRGGSVRIRLSHRVKHKRHEITLHAVEGDYKGFQAKRRVRVLLEGMAPPSAVEGVQSRYLGDTATLELDLGVVSLRKTHQITLEETQALPGFKGLMTRLERARELNCQVSPPRPIHAEERLAVRLAQTGRRLSLHHENWRAELAAFAPALRRLPKALAECAALYRLRGADHEPQAKTLDVARGIIQQALRDFQP